MVKRYIIVHRKYYELDGHELPYSLAFAHADTYASRDVDEEQLRQLRRDITEILDEDPVRMTFGDLGLTDPDDIAF